MSKIKSKTFFQKLRFKYKLSLLNEGTLAEVWNIRITRFRVIIAVFLLLVVLFSLNTLLFLKTPLRQLAPGYSDSQIRLELITESMRLDSLLTVMWKNEEYLRTVRSIIVGDIELDTIMPLDSIVLLERYTTFLEASEAELNFRYNFEREERYTLSLFAARRNHDLILFSPPTEGSILESFQLTRQHGIDISTSISASVVAVTDGTVIFAEYTINDGYVIIVQHTDNYISIYKNNSALLKRVGDRVRSGEAIAIVGRNRYNESGLLHFEIWQEGIPLNPENFIVF